MFNILKSDFYRIIKGQLGVISLLGISSLGILLGVISGKEDVVGSLYNGLYMGSMLLPIFFSNVYMITFGNEYAHRVVNNALISGIKRHTYFFSKVLLTFLLTALYVTLYAFVLVMTLRVTTGELLLLEGAKVVVAQLPLYMAVSSIGILCFNLIRTPYISVAAFISIAFLGDNLLLNVVSTYLPKFAKIIDTFVFTNVTTVIDISSLSRQMIMMIYVSGIVYTIIALGISYYSVRTREFK